jgi:cytochrome c-type biogenesis protein CcmH
MVRIRRWLAFLLTALPLMLCAPAVSFAVQPDEILKDPVLETRARALSAELRCVVCQNQSIDDSNAPLARDLRLLVRERLLAGDSDAEVKRFLVDRYGTFVLLKPPFDRNTLLLWLTPLVVLAGAVFFLMSRWRRDTTAPVSAPRGLTPEEEERLRELLDEPADADARGDKNA